MKYIYLIALLFILSNCAAQYQAVTTTYTRAFNLYKSKNYPNALYLFEKAADEDNSSNAMVMVGQMYIMGQGVNKDTVESIKWFQKAAQLGNSAAINDLGVFFEKDNKDHPVLDSVVTILSFRVAANGGNAYGMINLARAYAKGKWVKKDTLEALNWYMKATDTRNPFAVFSCLQL